MVHAGKRYRLVFRNGSGDQHPLHLHRHTFEVTRIGDKHLSGLMKDVINVMPLDTVEVDFVAEQSRRYVVALPSATAHGLRIHATHQVLGDNCAALKSFDASQSTVIQGV